MREPEPERFSTIVTLVDSWNSKRVNEPSAFGGLTERRYVWGVRKEVISPVRARSLRGRNQSAAKA